MKKWVWLILGIVLLLVALWIGLWYRHTARSVPDTVITEEKERFFISAEELEKKQKSSSEETYCSPVDFAALQAVNPDIYAWLEIPGTDISYPLVQSPEDDSFYLNHNSDGEYSSNGSIYSESMHNNRGFSDPVTVFYGHRMSSGAMLGTLQPAYSDEASFREHSQMIVYTPEAELHYRVFGAVPAPPRHIMKQYDFSQKSEFERFVQSIYEIRAVEAYTDFDSRPHGGDKILVLSTCLSNNYGERFLVLGVLENEP